MLQNNPRVRLTQENILSDNWYLLRKITFDYQRKNGEWTTQSREAYDRGNGATILLYNRQQKTVILTRQFRLPTYLNGNADGMLIEACAGLLDEQQPDEAIRRETQEEIGYRIDRVEKVMEAYMSPGSVTEKLYFFLAEYTKDTPKAEGGGVEEEEIDVLELPFTQAIRMMQAGQIQDGKTIMLLQYLQIANLLSI
jgi:GDP-mannose pyrophosphatase NudK